MSPSVSICIPSYNHGRFLQAAIESALAQTIADCEVVVSDNGSTDDTQSVVTACAAMDPRVRYEPTAEHVGMAENFNRAVKLARGEYVKLLCADDILEPDCVRLLMEALKREGVVLAGGARRVIDEEGRENGFMRFAARAWTGPGMDAARRCFFLGNLIGEPSAVMFRRSDFGQGFNSSYSQLLDLDLWFRILERGLFSYMPEPVCRIRMHAAQATRESARLGRISADKRRLFADYARLPHMAGTIAQKLLWDFRMAWSLQRETAQDRAAESALFYPALWRVMQAGASLARRVRPAS